VILREGGCESGGDTGQMEVAKYRIALVLAVLNLQVLLPQSYLVS
jgi:hypothetical protein